MDDLAVVACAQRLPQLARRPAEQVGQLARGERDEAAPDDDAVRPRELDRLARLEVPLDSRDARGQQRRPAFDDGADRPGVEHHAPRGSGASAQVVVHGATLAGGGVDTRAHVHGWSAAGGGTAGGRVERV